MEYQDLQVAKIFCQEKKIYECLGLMKERGPNYQAYKQASFFKNKIVLLFSILSIIDISKKSNLIFEDEEGILVFNGKIYNFEYLKKYAELALKFPSNSI